MGKRLYIAAGFVAAAMIGCGRSVKDSKVIVVPASEYSQAGRGEKGNPFWLIVEIDADGNLYLNKIRTGTLDDPSMLVESIKLVFLDREKQGYSEREVIIDAGPGASRQVIENLAALIDKTEAKPIVVIGN